MTSQSREVGKIKKAHWEDASSYESRRTRLYGGNVRYIFLTQQFYVDYANCVEIEQKQTRPYVQVHVTINDINFALPLRSNIKHKHAFWTDKTNRCGIDFSKAVVIEDAKYIDNSIIPYIRPQEFRALLGKEYAVKQGLISYIERYKSAKINPNKHEKRILLKYSTLQYFEKYIFTK